MKPALKRAYGRIRKDGAVGVDGVTREQFGQDLEGNLEDLHARLKSKRYRHQPIPGDPEDGAELPWDSKWHVTVEAVSGAREALTWSANRSTVTAPGRYRVDLEPGRDEVVEKPIVAVEPASYARVELPVRGVR